MQLPTLAILAVLTVLLIATFWLAWRLRSLRRDYRLLHEQLVEANAALGTVAPDLQALLGSEPATIISIEILNPMQLAAQESWFADKFGSLTPALIRRIVYDRALKICEETLTRFGAEAQVQIRRAA